MADKQNEDDDVAAGRTIAGGSGAAKSAPGAGEDTDVAAGRTLATQGGAAASTATTAATIPSDWFSRNVSTPVHAMMRPDLPQPSDNNLLSIPALQSLGSGIVQGVRDIAQTGRSFADYVNAKVPWLSDVDKYMGYPEVSTLPAQTAAYRAKYGSDLIAGAGELGSQLIATYPVGGLARMAGSVAEAAPIVGNALRPVVEGAVGGGAQNLAVSGGTGQDPGEALKTGAIGGGVIGGTLGLIGSRIAAGGQAAEQAIADRLGIRLSTGQSAGGVAQRIEDTSAVVPGSGAAQFAEAQRGDIAHAIAQEAGIPGPVRRIDTGTLNQAEDRTGNVIENAARRITVPSDRQLMTDVSDIETRAQQAGPGTAQAYTVRNLGDQLFNLMANNNGSLPGPEFQRFIARGGPLDTALKSSVPEVRQAANDFRETLFDAAARGGQASADALDDLSRGRYQWKVIQTIRPAIDKTATGTDVMSLPGLARGIINNFDMRRTGAGANMQDLARLINGPLRTLPSSGTAERSLWQSLLGLGGGTGALSYLGHPELAKAAAASVVVPAALTAGAGRLSRFGPGLGVAPVEAATTYLNPLMPRIAGPTTGSLLLPPPPAQPSRP